MRAAFERGEFTRACTSAWKSTLLLDIIFHSNGPMKRSTISVGSRAIVAPKPSIVTPNRAFNPTVPGDVLRRRRHGRLTWTRWAPK